MNGTAITNRLQNSFKIKDNNLYGSSYFWNFRTSSFKQVACLILTQLNSWYQSTVVIITIHNRIILFLHLKKNTQIPVSEACTNKLYIFRQCTYILYTCILIMLNWHNCPLHFKKIGSKVLKLIKCIILEYVHVL